LSIAGHAPSCHEGSALTKMPPTAILEPAVTRARSMA
jgi:hypothetical protein